VMMGVLGPACERPTEDLPGCLSALAAAFSSRFSVSCPAVMAALADGGGSVLPSARQFADALLPVLIAAGTGFQVYA